MALPGRDPGRVSLLIASDALARGIDLPAVDLVVNYGRPPLARDPGAGPGAD
jgi:superfamily II DNA/RNA helicase